MKLEDILKLENVSVRETENFVYVAPNDGYVINIVDNPNDELFYSEVEMLKQDDYSDITVICLEPIIDASVD